MALTNVFMNISVQDACSFVLEASQHPSFNPGRPAAIETKTYTTEGVSSKNYYVAFLFNLYDYHIVHF